MANTYTSVLYPVARRFIGLAKEVTPGTPLAPTYTFPMTKFDPVDKITYLEDAAWRNAMAGLYNLIKGVRIADLSMSGPMFPDGIGYALANILGDYSVSITNPGSATTLAAGAALGAGTIQTAASLTLNTPVLVYNSGSTGFAEVVTPLSGSNPYTLNRGLYYAHANGATVLPATGSTLYTHTFSLLNSGAGAGGYLQAQPPVHTFTDYTGVSATSGARQYSYTCLSELALTSNATALVEWDCKAVALASTIASATPTTSLSNYVPQAAWLSTVTLNGTQEFNDAEWKTTFTRKVDPKFVNAGQQDPFAIARGDFTSMVSFTLDPAVDESEFLFYLNNTQPTMALAAGNGLAGTLAASVTVTGQVTGFDTGHITDTKETFGYDLTAKCVANTTNAGVSGGFSPISVAVQNNVPSYS